MRLSQQDPDALSALDEGIIERWQLGQLPAAGPLTRAEQEAGDAYERYCHEREEEERAYERAGGRALCPACGQRSLRYRTVCTLGYPGHPGAEMSQLAECERCDHRSL